MKIRRAEKTASVEEFEGKKVVVLLYSVDSNCLEGVGRHLGSGSLTRLEDLELKSPVLELSGNATSENCLFIPEKASTGIKSDASLTHLIMAIKPISKYCSFEVQVLDSKGIPRRFKVTNFGSVSRLRSIQAILPLKLEEGWNRVAVDLNHICKTAYKTTVSKVLKIQLNGGMRIRRVLLADSPYSDESLAKGVASWVENKFEVEEIPKEDLKILN